MCAQDFRGGVAVAEGLVQVLLSDGAVLDGGDLGAAGRQMLICLFSSACVSMFNEFSTRIPEERPQLDGRLKVGPFNTHRNGSSPLLVVCLLGEAGWRQELNGAPARVQASPG